MPVRTKAPRRLVAAPPREDFPREPSDNDFTVLMDRNAAPRFELPPPAVERPARHAPLRVPVEPHPPRREHPRIKATFVEEEGPSRSISRAAPPEPSVAPPPISASRTSSRRPTPAPFVATARPRDVQTVVLPPSFRRTMVRALLLLAIGSLAGVVVEIFARGERQRAAAALDTPRAPAAMPPATPPPRPAASGSAAASEPFQCTGGPAAAASSTPAEPDLKGAAPAPHRHHRAQPAAAGAAVDVAASDQVDAGIDSEDLAAAMRALSQAKGEVTIP